MLENYKLVLTLKGKVLHTSQAPRSLVLQVVTEINFVLKRWAVAIKIGIVFAVNDRCLTGTQLFFKAISLTNPCECRLSFKVIDDNP